MSIGAFELPPPDGEKEKVYLDELESVRRTLAVMAKISSESDLPEAAGEIEGLADQMLEIAVVRSHLKGSFDFVNRDYVKCDKAFNLVERALRGGIETDIGTGTAFEKSLENFKLTRDLVDEAAGGVEEAELRQQLALAARPCDRTAGNSGGCC